MRQKRQYNTNIIQQKYETEHRFITPQREREQIEGELFLCLKDENEFVKLLKENLLKENFNKIMDGEIHKGWFNSRINLIPKKKKKKKQLKVQEFRPITVTNISYEIFTGILNKGVVKFLERNKIMEENQAGFTKGRRMEEHLLGVQLIMSKAKKRNLSKWCAAIDLEGQKTLLIPQRERDGEREDYQVSLLNKTGMEEK